MSKKRSYRQWKINVESVYRSDREERLKQAYAIVHPETLCNSNPLREEKLSHGKVKNRPLRQSVQ